MKTWAQKNQTQLWSHLYKASLFARGSLGPLGHIHPAEKEIEQRFDELQQYLEQLIEQSEKEAVQ
jgi:hypothetical protein